MLEGSEPPPYCYYSLVVVVTGSSAEAIFNFYFSSVCSGHDAHVGVADCQVLENYDPFIRVVTRLGRLGRSRRSKQCPKINRMGTCLSN